MTELEQRAAVVAAARKWRRTPYHSEADVLGAGVDCGMFLVRVFVDLGLVPPFDPRPYAPDWMLHQDEERYLGWVYRSCGVVETPLPGDIALFRFGRCYSHGGIVTEANPVALIHAFRDVGFVIEERLHQNPVLMKPIHKLLYFSLWAKR